ncbi:peptidoglycan-binding protein [Streptomyces sp. NPDC008092]|uniref:peptidoglycan-binding domain-containing protein n=1 Tax=Streptomyces sp. NPDC008092 TaxID=3364808 RepID=UPI0036E97134
MTIRKRIGLAAAAIILGSSLATLPTTEAFAATCTYVLDASTGYAYAGSYSGLTTQPSTTVVTSAGIEAQCLLKKVGENPGTIDGIFGPKSQAAALQFQKKVNVVANAGLAEDGMVGPKTWPWLRRVAGAAF